jgi:hypothetical protein
MREFNSVGIQNVEGRFSLNFLYRLLVGTISTL